MPLPVGDNDRGAEALNLISSAVNVTEAGTKIGFFGAAPVVKNIAIADTSGATLANLELEVNKLKVLLRNYGLLT